MALSTATFPASLIFGIIAVLSLFNPFNLGRDLSLRLIFILLNDAEREYMAFRYLEPQILKTARLIIAWIELTHTLATQ
jgi:hypothetical protein